jgi:hypothetical protein
LQVAVIFESLRRGLVGFRLDKRTQHNVVFGVGNAVRRDALGFAARFRAVSIGVQI